MADVSKIKLGSTSYDVKDGSAVKNITRSGTTFTATRRDGTTFTFTQQDNNTTTGTTYTAGNVPANTTFGTNGSIKNVYDGLNSNKAPKSEAIKSITRSGTTFTATRCDNTTFTFTQQDNNTTTGTTYNAGSVPDNTTFGTNGSIKKSYDALNGRLSNVGQVYTSDTYTGQIAANGYAAKLTLPAGEWLINTSGYAYSADSDVPIPFGLGIGANSNVSVKGWNPCWYLSISAQTDVYIKNFLSNGAISCVNVFIQANRIKV